MIKLGRAALLSCALVLTFGASTSLAALTASTKEFNGTKYVDLLELIKERGYPVHFQGDRLQIKKGQDIITVARANNSADISGTPRFLMAPPIKMSGKWYLTVYDANNLFGKNNTNTSSNNTADQGNSSQIESDGTGHTTPAGEVPAIWSKLPSKAKKLGITVKKEQKIPLWIQKTLDITGRLEAVSTEAKVTSDAYLATVCQKYIEARYQIKDLKFFEQTLFIYPNGYWGLKGKFARQVNSSANKRQEFVCAGLYGTQTFIVAGQKIGY